MFTSTPSSWIFGRGTKSAILKITLQFYNPLVSNDQVFHRVRSGSKRTNQTGRWDFSSLHQPWFYSVNRLVIIGNAAGIIAENGCFCSFASTRLIRSDSFPFPSDSFHPYYKESRWPPILHKTPTLLSAKNFYPLSPLLNFDDSHKYVRNT